MASKRKTHAGVTAVFLVALIAAGTFAWTNFNSQALNEWRGTGAGLNVAKPGGTLHNYNVENGDEKHVFVENWGNESLFVRIRLDEYMELGSGVGLKATDQNVGEIVHNPLNQAEPLIPDANIDKIYTWEPHIPAGSEANNCGLEFHHFWSWEMGGQAYFFPAPTDNREDKSFVAQGSPDVTAGSINDEGMQARQTRSAQVITMAEWMTNGSTIGDYWVIDTDGWAYWAAPLVPGDATGLLLNRVTQITPPEKDYYYGINVIAQMATKELDDLDNYKKFGDIENGGWTSYGQALMERIVYISDSNIVHVEPVWVMEDGITRIALNPPLLNGVVYVKQGETLFARGYGLRHIDDNAVFSPLWGFHSNGAHIYGGHTWTSITYFVREQTAVGYRNSFTASVRRRVLESDTRQFEGGPTVTVPFVIIPAESEGVVFGKSGRVFVYYGDNKYQELIEGATPSDIMTLGPIIGIDEIQ